MIKRTIEVSAEPTHLTSRLEQLLLMRDGQTVRSIPCEDIGVVVVDQQQTTYTHAALSTLAESSAVLVVCGRNHLPVGVLLPLADHTQVVWRINEQIRIARPLRKRLWKQIIREKIRAQAYMLPEDCPARSKLLALARGVKSGDPSNIEAQAAKVYWANWLPEGTFRRDSDLPGINALLNYGYSIIRAAMARALVAAGLLPSLGLCHANRSNAFCLADDMIEPIRPLVDDRARDLHLDGHQQELTRAAKVRFLELLAAPVRLGPERGPLMVNMHRMVASLVQCFQGEADRLEIPRALAPKKNVPEDF